MCVAYLPLLVAISLVSETDSGFITIPAALIFLLLLIYTAPFFVALIELFLAACRLLDKKPRYRGEKMVNGIGTALALGCFLAFIDLEKLLFLSVVLAAAVVIVWIVSAIVFRKRPSADTPLKKPIFWIGTVVALAIIITAIVAVDGFDKSRPDPQSPTVTEVSES